MKQKLNEILHDDSLMNRLVYPTIILFGILGIITFKDYANPNTQTNPYRAKDALQEAMPYSKAKHDKSVYKLVSGQNKSSYHEIRYARHHRHPKTVVYNRYKFTYLTNGKKQTQQAVLIGKDGHDIPHYNVAIVIVDSSGPYVYVKRNIATGYNYYFMHMPAKYIVGDIDDDYNLTDLCNFTKTTIAGQPISEYSKTNDDSQSDYLDY